MLEIGKIISRQIVGMATRKKQENNNCWGIVEVLVGIVRMILWTNKGKIGRLKLTKIEELISGGDCRGGFMQKQDCENTSYWI